MKIPTNCAWICCVLFTIGHWVGSAPAAELLRGPYLQIPTSDSIIIRWRTDVPTDSIVLYGLETNNLSFSVTNSAATNEHIVRLQGLDPATRYFYSVGSTTQTLASGPTCKFVTSPPPGQPSPTRVWVLGDFGGLSMGYEDDRTNYVYGELAVRDSYLQYAGDRQTDFWLTLGDNAYWGGTDDEFQTNFFWVFDSLLRHVPVMPSIGNHDSYGAPPGQRFPYLDIFTFPTNAEAGGVASGREEYYSFDHGNIHFICLDSTTQSRAADGAMANWLRVDLASNSKQWVIAYFHHAPYSRGSHNSDNPGEIQMTEMRQNIVPILEAGGVDLVVAGHSHVYERSYLLNGHYGASTNLSPQMVLNPGSGREDQTGPYTKTTTGPLANRGTVYVVAGSGCCLEGQIGHHPVMFTDQAQLGSLVLEIYSNRLDAVFLRETGAIEDYFTIVKDPPRPLIWSGLSDSTTWDLTIQNWSNTVAQTNGDLYRIGDFVRFDDASTNRIITLSGLLTPSGATVETASTYTFIGSGSLSGPTGLTNKGMGTLRIGTSNDYTGPTTVSSGVLSVFGGAAIGDSSAVFLADTASLVITNGEAIGSLAGGGNVFIQNGSLTTGGNHDTTTYTGNLTGPGTLTKTGNGTMTLTGTNVLSGSILVKSGALIVDSEGSVATANYQSIGVDDADNGTLTLKDSVTYAVSSALTIGELGTAVGTLNITNSATLTADKLFVGAAAATGSSAHGTLNQSGGTIILTATGLGDFVIGGRNPDSTNGVGIYNLSGGTLVANSAVVVGGWGSGTVNQSGGTFTALPASGGLLLQRNPGAGGTYNLNGGTLRTPSIHTAVAASDPNYHSVFNFNGGTLQPVMNNFSFMHGLSSAYVRDAGAIIDTAGLDISIKQPLLQSQDVDDAGTGGLIKNGGGTLTLEGENSYAGGTFINAGRLNIAADSNLGVSTGLISINNGATLGITASLILSSTRQLHLGLPESSPQSDGLPVSAIIDVAAGVIADVRSRILGVNDNGTARLMKAGGGLLFLNNLNFNNSFSGGLYLHGGLTRTAPGPQFADSVLTLDNGAGLISNQDGVFNAPCFIGSGNATRESGLGYTVHRNGPIRNVDDLLSFGGLTFQGDETAGDPALNAGKVGLGGTNTFGAVGQAVVVNTNFTLAISQDANLGHIANRLVLNSGILEVQHGASSDGTNAPVAVAADVVTTRRIELTGNSVINVMNQSDPKNVLTAALNNGVLGRMTINTPGFITGPGSLIKSGPGTLTINSANDYTGETILNGGQLNILADNCLGFPAGSLIISNGATLECTRGLFTERQILLGNRGNVIQPDGNTVSAIISVTNGATLDLRGRILGIVGGDPVLVASRLMKTGDGTLFLNNLNFNNAFGGGLYLHGGLTKTGPGPQFGDSILTQDQGARLLSNQDGVFNSRSYIGSGGAVREAGAGYAIFRNGPILNINNVLSFGGLTLQGDETAGNPSLNAGKLGLGGSNTFGGVAQAVVVNTNFTLSISRDANLGSPLNKLVLNRSTLAVEHGAASDGTNPPVAIAAVVNSAREIDISGDVTFFIGNRSDVKNAAVAAVNNGIPCQMTVTGPIADSSAGPGNLIKTGVGTLTLSGANTYTGNTTINAGTLAVTQPTFHSNSTITVAGGASLKLDFTGTNRVAAIVLTGVTLFPGIYNSGNSSPFITGTGSLLIPPLPGPVTITNSISGNILSLTWPAGQNWTLQMQTNELSVGLSTNWIDLPGTANLHATNIVIDANHPATFYRLRQ
ncbi:MAG TPA: autotransporter-associated beta strand repeat-containing protein [Verrucomicrobiae bacterium]|nr:autotransporter-associated beta strand repeat-containing protein [Verrucomicrobiae bacterium]